MIQWFFRHSHRIDKGEILQRISLFSGLEESDLRLLANETKLIEYKRGDFIYQEGDPADCFYAIVSGRVKVFATQDNQEKVFAYLYEGDYFGELSLLTGEPHSVNVVVQNDALLLRLEKGSFNKFIERCPQVTVEISRLLSSRLKQKDREGEKIKTSKMISIYSIVPHVGKTFFAINLSASLVRETEQKTILIDTNEGENCVFSLLKLEQKRLDLDKAGALSRELIQRYTVTHPSGFQVLGLLPGIFEQGDDKKIMALLSYLLYSYDFILLDLPNKDTPLIQSILTQSDLIHFMTDADEEHVLETRRMLNMHYLEKDIRQRTRLILTEKKRGYFDSPLGREILIDQKAEYLLPYTPTLHIDLYEKKGLFIATDPASGYSKMIRYIAREIGDILVGLALGGGAALGLSHVGILKVLAREKIPIDVISGTSIGAIVAAIWASGITPEAMEKMAEKLSSRKKVFSLLADFDFFWSRGFFKGNKVVHLLQEILGNRTFQDTWLPLKIVAVNLTTREEVVYEEGSLVEAVRSSMSIPGIFHPSIERGQVIVDGAVLSPVPIECLRLSGVKKIIAVNVLPSPEAVWERRRHLEETERKKRATILKKNFLIRSLHYLRKRTRQTFIPNIFDIMMQSMQTMEHQISEVACRHADVVIRPTSISADWFEFFEGKKFIRRGEEEAMRHMDEIKQLVFERKPKE